MRWSPGVAAVVLVLAASVALSDGINNPQTSAALLTGILGSANGGAGTISGALKGSGAGVVSQAACADLSNGTATCAAAAGQLPATATNDNAAAGKVGEFITGTGTAVGVTTVTPADITSVSLTAGDWDCRGILGTNPAAGTTQSDNKGWMSVTSATQPTFPAGGLVDMDISVSAASPIDYTTGIARFSLSSTTTVFLSWTGAFAVSTETVTAKLDCRRAR